MPCVCGAVSNSSVVRGQHSHVCMGQGSVCVCVCVCVSNIVLLACCRVMLLMVVAPTKKASPIQEHGGRDGRHVWKGKPFILGHLRVGPNGQSIFIWR
jgi:hypothetical protein